MSVTCKSPGSVWQRERALLLISRFMAWKMATSFVLTAETWLGPEVTRSGDEALLVVGVSHHERLAAMQRLRRADVGGSGGVAYN